MYIDEDNIDFDLLRYDLIEHFTAAMFIISPVAMVDLDEVKYASNDELVRIALDNKFNIDKYIIDKNIK